MDHLNIRYPFEMARGQRRITPPTFVKPFANENREFDPWYSRSCKRCRVFGLGSLIVFKRGPLKRRHRSEGSLSRRIFREIALDNFSSFRTSNFALPFFHRLFT